MRLHHSGRIHGRRSTLAHDHLALWLFLLGLNGKFLNDLLEAHGLIYVWLDRTSFGLLGLSLLAGIAAGGLTALRHKYQIWVGVVLLTLAGLFGLGLASGPEPYWLSRDLFALTYLSALFIGANPRNWELLDPVVAWHFAISTAICLVHILLRWPLYYESIIWSSVYLLWSNSSYAWEYFVTTLMDGGRVRRVVAALGVGVFVVLTVMFEKRTPFVILALMVAILPVWVWRTAAGARGRTVALTSLAAVLLIVVGFNRFSGDIAVDARAHAWERNWGRGTLYATVTENYRWTYEVEVVLDQVTPGALIFGRGLGASVPVPLVASASGDSGVLHNGVMNILLKGGLLLLVLSVIGAIMILADARHLTERRARAYALVFLVSVAITPLQTFLNTSPAWALKLACCGYVMSSRAGIRRQAGRGAVAHRTTHEPVALALGELPSVDRVARTR